MNILQATTDHLDHVARLFNQYRVFYGVESDLKLAQEFIGERLSNNESVVFLALDSNGEAVGFTQLYPSFSSVSVQKIWILNDLFVNGDFRGQGVGKALLNAAKQFAEGTKAKGIALETAHDDVSAQHLYETLGYQKDTRYYHYFLTL
ncbi:GNAT family N-acetyltransferase [Vibrio profundum]|uniref:GNAT family N-acetyltransferase n=1 Tax=Vibrio profundum TaxID=2910247 RepID=UPI003D0C96DA